MEVRGRKSESEDENKVKETENFCQHCELEHVTTKASGICLDCGEYMCHTCFSHHLKGKLYRHHELTDTSKDFLLSKLRRERLNAEKCERHENEPIKFFCRSHEYVGCGDCIMLEHTNCKPEYIKDVSPGFQGNKEFKVLTEKLRQLESRNLQNDATLEKNRKECNEMHENALQKIRKFREDINKYLDKAEADIISETERLKDVNDTLFDEVQNYCEGLSYKIEDLKRKLDTGTPDHILFIQTVKCKPLIAELDQEVVGPQTECNIKEFEFVLDAEISSIVASTKQLGHWNISERKSATDRRKIRDSIQEIPGQSQNLV